MGHLVFLLFHPLLFRLHRKFTLVCLVGSVESGLECLFFRAVCIGGSPFPPRPNLGPYLLYDGVGLISLK